MLIYLVTNKKNGKVYVGKYRGDDPEKRWRDHVRASHRGSKNHFHNAIRKHGQESFNVEKIAESTSLAGLGLLERFHIKRLRSYQRAYGYNLTMGGDGVEGTPEVRRKISAARRRFVKRFPNRAREQAVAAHRAVAKLRAGGKKVGGVGKGADNFMFGCKHSKATRNKISVKAKERFKREPNPMQGVPSPMKGKHHSPEVCARISAAKKKYWATHESPWVGKVPWNKGKRMPISVRRKMSLGKVGNTNRLGVPHSKEVRERISASVRRTFATRRLILRMAGKE